MTELTGAQIASLGKQFSLMSGIPPSEPPWDEQQFYCAACGHRIDQAAGEVPWSSTTALGNTGEVCGVVTVWHCTDCHPQQAIRATLNGVPYRHNALSDGYKFVTGL